MIPRIVVTSSVDKDKVFQYLKLDKNQVVQVDALDDQHKVIKVEFFRPWLYQTVELLRSKKGLTGLIWNADRLNLESQSPLLKPLEEIGEEVAFYLIVEEEEKLMETIRSRCLIEKMEDETAKEIDYWKLALTAWKSGPVECLELANSVEKEELKKMVESISVGVNNSLVEMVNHKRLLILNEVLQLSTDINLNNLNQKLMVEDFMLRTWEIIKS